MSRALSSTAIASQNAEATGEAWLILVTIAHASMAAPIRVVANNENITSNGELFVAWDFDIVLPGEDPAQARLSIGNIDPLIVRALREISGPPSVTVQVVLSSDYDAVEVEFAGLVLRQAGYDPGTISGELVFEEILTEPVATTLTPAMFPGMY
jgi:hypothetical protein